MQMKDMRFRPDDQKHYRYQKSVVAFMDILGFRSLVYDTKKIELLGSIFSTVSQMNHFDRQPLRALDGMQFSVMSDSIVISLPYRRGSAFSRVLMAVHSLMQLCMVNDIYLRGGIAIGKVYHQGNMAFGPAIVEAYLQESQSAVYPRCVMTKETLEEGLKTSSSVFGRAMDEQRVRLCKDGVYAMDFFGRYLDTNRSSLQTAQDVHSLLRPLIAQLDRQLQQAPNDRVREKYEWLLGDLQRAQAEYLASLYVIRPRLQTDCSDGCSSFEKNKPIKNTCAGH